MLSLTQLSFTSFPLDTLTVGLLLLECVDYGLFLSLWTINVIKFSGISEELQNKKMKKSTQTWQKQGRFLMDTDLTKFHVQIISGKH